MQNVSIRQLKYESARPGEVEIVERKGLGHPDTICDALAEELSVALCQYTLEHFGTVLHHNVDKVLLWGGSSNPAFGGGSVTAPIEVFLAGRASLEYKGATVPIADITAAVCHRWFEQHFHALDPERHVIVHPLVRPGSSELVELFAAQARTGIWLANDTSCGVGYAPVGELEQVTFDVEQALNSRSTKSSHPQLGQDVKVMSVRHRDRVDITVACAMVGRYLDGLDAYAQSTRTVASLASQVAEQTWAGEVTTGVNVGDDLERGRVYLTVTGTSAESGDDGQAGRGNRANGLITPFRPMTLESVAGKNPMTHVGKLYNVAAREMAAVLVEQFEELVFAQCALVSQIGRPIDQPQIVDVRLANADDRPIRDLEPRIEECVQAQLSGMTAMWKRVIRGEFSLF